MATKDRLTARLRPSMAEQIESFAEDHDLDDPEAERELVQEGLESYGYLDRPTDPAELLLWYLRRIGLLLGLVGLIMIGYGVFGPRSWGVIGFGLLLGGFLFVALEEGIRTYEARAAPNPVPETTEHA